MRIAVLASPRSWYLQDLRRAATACEEIIQVDYARLAADVMTEPTVVRAGDLNLLDCDCVLLRTMPPGSLEEVILRMDLLGCLESAGQLIVNPPRAIEAAVDKFLATAKLHAAGLPVPATIVCQSVDQALAAMRRLGGEVVVKPLFGSEGRGLTRLGDEAVAERVFRALLQASSVLYLQRFVQHDGSDLRVLLIGNRPLAMQRRHPTDWRTNIARGAHAVAVDCTSPSMDLPLELARKAAAAVGAPVAGVDLLRGPDGSWFVLEVNAVPGWKALSATLEIDVARWVLDYVRRRIEQRSE